VVLAIAQLVERFDTGEIRLPMMQRDYVWRPPKVVELLDSLYRRWPIGSFYIWQTQNAHPTRPRVGRTHLPPRPDSFCGYLLDGQQRLESLSLAIQGPAGGQPSRRAFFDIENEQFYLANMKKTITRRIEKGDPLLVPLSDMVPVLPIHAGERGKAVEAMIKALKDQKKIDKGKQAELAYRKRLYAVAAILDTEALCEAFPDEDEEHAFELFSRLNKGGTSLSAGDVEAARLASAATQAIVEPMRQVAAERDVRALGINFVFLLRSLVAVHRGNCSFSKLPRRWAEDTGEIEASWRCTEEALRGAIRFVHEQCGWFTRGWLPSTMSLIPVIYLLAQSRRAISGGLKPKVHVRDAQCVRRFLLVSGLRGLFRGGTETAVNSYMNAIRGTPQGDISRAARALFEKVPKNQLDPIRKEDLLSNSGQHSPLMQIYLAYFYTKNAKSWPSGRSVRDIVGDRLQFDPLAVHHIFPRRYMQRLDFPPDHLNVVANYAIISQADNAELGDRSPFDVWRELRSNQQAFASEQLCIDANDNLLQRDAYEEFIGFRAEKLADQLNNFIGLSPRRRTPSR
jgi:hypothetical protein